MFTLASSHLRLVVDPARGAEIRSIRCASSDAELLFQAPWARSGTAAHGHDELAWVESWAGGWQVLFPNAGAACVSAGDSHPFHGAASRAPWETVSVAVDDARFHWNDGDGLEFERRIHVHGSYVTVSSTVGNRGPSSKAVLLVEHLILGGDLVGPDARVELSGGRILPLANSGEPIELERDVLPWPRFERHGSVEDWSRAAVPPASRFGTIVGLEQRSVIVANTPASLAVQVLWSESLPYLWFWEERRGESTAPWSGRTVCLGIEPASTPAAAGLARAVARGEAIELRPGERVDAAVEVHVLEDAG